MRVSCPNCQTEYDVPDAALTGRARKLRCANCSTQWQVPALDMYRTDPEPSKPAPAPALPEAAVEAPEDDRQAMLVEDFAPAADETMAEEEPETPEAPRHEWVNVLQTSRESPAGAEPAASSRRGLAISALIVVLLAAAVLAEHRPIGNFWPPSLRLFNALGLR